VNSTLDLTAPATPQAVCCDIIAYATQRATAEEVPALRQKPAPLTGEPFPASFWKHADDQTVVGLAAVFEAIQRHGLDATMFRDWGVIAAPRFLGRTAMVTALNRFALEGAWGISPHFIPHRSLHSISGTVSQSLKIHGPNFGGGGGPNAAGEALLVAAGMLADERLPGVWVLMTGYDPELAPDDPNGPPQVEFLPVAGAVALALVRAGTGPSRLRLRIGCGAGLADKVKAAGAEPSWPLFSLHAFLDALGDGQTAPAACWRLRGGWAVLESAEGGAENSL